MPVNKIFIPTFISSVTFAPARVLPHVYFYNGLKECEPYFLQGYSNGNTGSVISNQQTSFPYFDNYEGQDPQSGSRSLLFFNEPAVYGTTPTGSLYSDYWANYINLLYNPRTRLVACEAIIPLADYFKMELNDIVEWRGNYYHLRAINDYNLSNGECKLQLLGPILGDILPDIIPAIACDFNYRVGPPCSQSFVVGQEAFGGVVAYVDDCGCNGFVISTGSLIPIDEFTPTGNGQRGPFGGQGFPVFGATIPTIGGGYYNTTAIATQVPVSLANVALNYTSSGYHNWVIPNQLEARQIYNNRAALIDAGVKICTGSTCLGPAGSGENSFWISEIINGANNQIFAADISDNCVPNCIYNIPDRDSAAFQYGLYAIRYFGDCFDYANQPIVTTPVTCSSCTIWEYTGSFERVGYYTCEGTLDGFRIEAPFSGTFCNCNTFGQPFKLSGISDPTLTNTSASCPAPTTTTTTTSTTTLPPSSSCVTITFTAEEEEYLNCGIFNRYNAYTASYYENCILTNAPTNINVYITASALTGGDLVYTLTIPSGSNSGFENVYTREWTGGCEDRESTSYSISGINIEGYPTCSCAPPTTTTTTSAFTLFGNCGRGNSVGEACSDAIINARNFYSNCNTGTFGASCIVYTDTSGTILTGYTHIFMNGANWDINSSTGIVSALSSIQC